MKYKYNGEWVDLSIKALDSMAIGAVIDFAGKVEKIPAGWLICDGSAVSRTAYSELFDTIGTYWGSGDGSTTFNLPPAGIVRVGLDANDTDFNTIGKTGGEKAHTLTTNESGKVNLTLTSSGQQYSYVQTPFFDGMVPIYKAGSNPYFDADAANKVEAHNNVQPYGTFYTLIKAKNTTPTMASVVNATNSSTTDAYSCDYVNGDVLYYDTTGTTGSVQLSNSIDNYRYLEIFYISSGYQNSLKVDLSIDKTIILNRPFIYNGAYYDRMSKYNIAGSTITYSECLTINNNFQSVQAGNPEIIIKKVIGYK